MRLVIDATNISAGGGLTHLRQIISHYDSSNDDFSELAVIASRNTLSKLPDNTNFVKISHPWLNSNIIKRQLWYSFKMKKILKEKESILFNPGGGYTGSFRPYVTMCRNMLVFDTDEQKKYGWSLARFRYILLNVKQKMSFRNAKGMIYLSDYAKETVERLINYPQRKVVKINHGVSPIFNNLPKDQAEVSNYNSKNPFKFIYVSTLNYYKNQTYLIKAFNILEERNIPVTLSLVGGYPSEEIKNEILSDVGQNVNYIGSIPYENLPEVYNSHDAVIYASSCENMPNILIESMATGLPIMCSNEQPMPEFLKNGGLYFDPRDVHEIVEKIILFINDKNLRVKNSLISYNLSKEFSWQKCADETFDFISSCTKN